MNRFILLSVLLFSFCSASAQQVIELNSLPNPPDISWENSEGESLFPNSTDRIVANVSKPTLTAYLPDAANANGTALIIAPGGSFHFLSIDNEGESVPSGVSSRVSLPLFCVTGWYLRSAILCKSLWPNSKPARKTWTGRWHLLFHWLMQMD
ncbi:MAG: hypothetical protein OEM26_07800 [Saprospiraceae bacterium]|nr:hypothetical protein [Saprospiraceae bacterium]